MTDRLLCGVARGKNMERRQQNGDPLKDQDRGPAASPRRPSAPCAGDAAHASGGHSTALQDQFTLTVDYAYRASADAPGLE